MAQRLILASLALSLLLVASASRAAAAEPGGQALGDPMRPPETSASPSNEARGDASARLQSVLISRSRSVAVIDGRSVRLGERIGDATVTAISPSQVTLQRGAERQTLKLYPGTEKKR